MIKKKKKGAGWTWAIWLSTSGRCSALSSTCPRAPDRQSSVDSEHPGERAAEGQSQHLLEGGRASVLEMRDYITLLIAHILNSIAYYVLTVHYQEGERGRWGEVERGTESAGFLN